MMYDVNYLENVGKVIMEQLYLKPMEIWAWGSQKFLYLERKVNGKTYPALMFSIRTPKIKRGGRVIISLNEGTDTYIVEAIKIYGGVENEIGKCTGVYFDELHDVINSLIETKETYKTVIF